MADSTLTTGVGTSVYISPECLAGAHYDNKVDIYALGIILFEMFAGPFETSMERSKTILALKTSGVFPPQFATKYPQVMKLVSLLLQPDPTRRPTADALLELLPHRAADNPLSGRVVSLQSQILNLSNEMFALRALLNRQHSAWQQMASHLQHCHCECRASCQAHVQRSMAELEEVLQSQKQQHMAQEMSYEKIALSHGS